MKKGFILSASIGTAIICGLWTGIGLMFPGYLAVWAGFVGCTSYYVAGCGKNGFIRSLSSNITGLIICVTIVAIGNRLPGIPMSAIVTGFFSGLIVFLVHFDLLKISQCTFMGGFSVFAATVYSAEGIGTVPWQMLLASFILGNIVGLTSDKLGMVIYEAVYAKRTDDQTDWIVGNLDK